jgi:ABC-type glycerol-3-phosphate transport system permease component
MMATTVRDMERQGQTQARERWPFRTAISRTTQVLTLLTIAGLFLFPAFWLVQTSFKPIDEIYATPPTWTPHMFIMTNYEMLLATTNFPRVILNSLVAASLTTLFSVFFSALAGYAFAKYRFRGREFFFLVILASMMIPVVVTLVPNYILMAQLRLLNSLWAIILPSAITPFAIFWMRQYIGSAVPDSLIESARLDGANELRIFRSVVFPVITPGLAALAIWVFVQSWNDFLRPLVYLQAPEVYTIPVFLSNLRFATTQFRVALDLVSAGAVLSAIPVLVLFLTAQNAFVSGATAGAVKE